MLVLRNEFLKPEEVFKFEKFLDVQPITLRVYKTALKRFATFLKENSITAPTREDIITFRNSLTNDRLKAGTVHAYLSKVKKFFTWAESEGLYKNICIGVKSPKISKNHKKDCFSGVQIKKILSSFDTNTLEGARNFALFSLMSCTGLRTVEAATAKIEDLRCECGVDVLYIKGKNRCEKADYVKIPVQVKEAISKYLALRNKNNSREDFLFGSVSTKNFGEGMTTRSISRVCKTAMIANGFDSSRLTAHSLRHTAVTLALLNGESIQAVQHFARHLNIQTTTVYAHNIDRLTSQIENNIAKEIF